MKTNRFLFEIVYLCISLALLNRSAMEGQNNRPTKSPYNPVHDYFYQMNLWKQSARFDRCLRNRAHSVEVIPVDGMRMTYCKKCDQLYGLDDSVDTDEPLRMLSQGHFRCQTPCKKCGNDDPSEIRLEVNTRSDVGGHRLYSFICSDCDEVYLNFQGSDDDERQCSDSACESAMNGLEVECIKCGNTKKDRLQITMNGDRLYKITCLDCHHGNTFHENKPRLDQHERRRFASPQGGSTSPAAPPLGRSEPDSLSRRSTSTSSQAFVSQHAVKQVNPIVVGWRNRKQLARVAGKVAGRVVLKRGDGIVQELDSLRSGRGGRHQNVVWFGCPQSEGTSG